MNDSLNILKEEVIELLPPQRSEFFKEDGERVVDETGQRVATA